MDYDQARLNMIDSQLRTWDVLDQRLLDTFLLLDRHQFTPAKFRNISYADTEIPIGSGQVMLAPKMVGRMVQELEIVPTDSVLEIGTGTGYTTALLGYLAGKVLSVEIDSDLHDAAKKRLGTYSLDNITLEQGNGLDLKFGTKLFDVILLNGALSSVPEELKKQLKEGGRLLGVFGAPPIMTAMLVLRLTQDKFEVHKIFETCVPYLEISRPRSSFTF